MRHIVIGPGEPCSKCREYYGKHTEECPVPKEQAALQSVSDRNLGEALERAILINHDPEEIGRIIRMAVVEHSRE